MNSRLVICLLGAIFAGLMASGMALAAGWGLFAGFVLYSGVGSSTLVALAVAWPERRFVITGAARNAALA